MSTVYIVLILIKKVCCIFSCVCAARLVSGAGDIKITKDGNILLHEMVGGDDVANLILHTPVLATIVNVKASLIIWFCPVDLLYSIGSSSFVRSNPNPLCPANPAPDRLAYR